MRFTNRVAFLNQVKGSALAGFANRLYCVALPDDYERTEVIDSLIQNLFPQDKSIERFSGSALELKALSDHLHSSSLFGGEPIAVIQDAEKIAKSNAQSLINLFPSSFGYLILAAKSKSPLFDAIEKEGVILDLIGEKPWEKEKRLEHHLDAKVKVSGKLFSPGALRSLLDRLDPDVGILEREVDKLICYIGDRPRIEVRDVEAIASSNRTFTVWQIAEEWIWEGTGRTDDTLFHALIPALRAQLQLGFKIACLLENNASREEWTQALPKVFPKTLEKRTKEASQRGSLYFKKGLLALFDVELRSRTGCSSYAALLDLFRTKLLI